MSARASVGARSSLRRLRTICIVQRRRRRTCRFYVSSSRRSTSPAGLELICRRFIMQSRRRGRSDSDL